MSQYSFLFLVANTPWVSALARVLGTDYPTHTTRFYDWLTYRRLRPKWNKPASSHLTRSLNVWPPGYVGKLEAFLRPCLQWQVQQWHRSLQKVSGVPPWVIAPYPYSAPWVRHLPSDHLIYYNLDDYVHYQPSRKAQILAQETELVERSALTLCLAKSQVETLQKRYPHRAKSIHHFPLGVSKDFINSDLERSPQPNTVGYVGNLIERVDWPLVYHVARACPDLTFVFVGGLDGFAGEVLNPRWKEERDKAIALPNVRHIGKVPQDEVTRYYWSFAINWIPYDIHHPFNQASCPTKVMDTIATGRPVLSTDIPECRLYPDWISIFHSVEDAIALLRQKLGQSSHRVKPHQQLQHQFILQQTWQYRTKTLLSLLHQPL